MSVLTGSWGELCCVQQGQHVKPVGSTCAAIADRSILQALEGQQCHRYLHCSYMQYSMIITPPTAKPWPVSITFTGCSG